eukprot:scaffold38621_cov81-Phaeocystis_antarctica.AAC.9
MANGHACLPSCGSALPCLYLPCRLLRATQAGQRRTRARGTGDGRLAAAAHAEVGGSLDGPACDRRGKAQDRPPRPLAELVQCGLGALAEEELVCSLTLSFPFPSCPWTDACSCRPPSAEQETSSAEFGAAGLWPVRCWVMSGVALGRRGA